MNLKKRAIASLVIVAGLGGCSLAMAQEASAPASSSASASTPESKAAVVAVPAPASSSAPAKKAPITISSPATSPDDLVAKYPSGSIQSEETAAQALLEVDQQRSKVEGSYAEEQHACYSKFLATSCLDAAKEKRRVAMNQIHKVEVDAKAFTRSARVVQRDVGLAEKNGRQANNPPKPLTDMPIKQNGEAAGGHDASLNERHRAEQEEKQKEKQREVAAGEAKREESVIAHNKQVADAEARQRDIVTKKAEKQRQAHEKAQKAQKEKEAAAAKAEKAAKINGSKPAEPLSTTPAAPAASAPAAKP